MPVSTSSKCSGFLILAIVTIQAFATLLLWDQGRYFYAAALSFVVVWLLAVCRIMILGRGYSHPWHYTAEKLPEPEKRVIGLIGLDAEVLHIGGEFSGHKGQWCYENGNPVRTPPSHWSSFDGNMPPLPTLTARPE